MYGIHLHLHNIIVLYKAAPLLYELCTVEHTNNDNNGNVQYCLPATYLLRPRSDCFTPGSATGSATAVLPAGLYYYPYKRVTLDLECSSVAV